MVDNIGSWVVVLPQTRLLCWVLGFNVSLFMYKHIFDNVLIQFRPVQNPTCERILNVPTSLVGECLHLYMTGKQFCNYLHVHVRT